ncbi:MAG: hypothetical protein QM692_04560 [Thermomicrobiales bacterium]
MLNGKHPDRACCVNIPTGLSVAARESFRPKQTRTFNIAGKIFSVSRNADIREAKGFTITLPATL